MKLAVCFLLIFTASFLLTSNRASAMTLKEAVQKTLEHNPQIKGSKAEENAVRSKVREAQSYRNPKVGFTATLAGMNEAPAMKVPEVELLGRVIKIPDLPLSASTISLGTVGLTVPITTSGRIEHGIAQARAGVAAMEFKTAVLEEEIAFLTIKTYLTSVLAGKIENVNQEAYNTLNEHLQQANRLFEEKQIPKYEVIRAEAEVANAQKKLIDAKNARLLAIAVLQDLIGNNPEEELTLDTDIVLPPTQDHKRYMALVDEAIKQSHALNALEATDKMFHEAELVAKAEHLPTLGAFATQILYHNDQPFTIPSSIIGVALNIPLYDGGTSGAKAAEQRALREKNQNDFKKTQNILYLEVVKFNLDAENAQESLKTSAKAIELATESLRLAQKRFAEGVGTGIEISDATLALLIAQTNEIEAKYQYTLAIYGLAKISNKLWQAMDIEEKLNETERSSKLKQNAFVKTN